MNQLKLLGSAVLAGTVLVFAFVGACTVLGQPQWLPVKTTPPPPVAVTVTESAPAPAQVVSSSATDLVPAAPVAARETATAGRFEPTQLTPQRDEPVPRSTLPMTTEEIVARSETSVALVIGDIASGTGFLVRPGLLVTNAHVIAQRLSTLKVSFPSAPASRRGPLPCRLLWEDAGQDIAVLAVKTDLPALVVPESYRFRRGQDITVIGNPGTGTGQMLVNAVSRGVLSTPISHKGHDYYQMSIAINPGNSGGPVIASDGQVVGVATMVDRSREGIAFCVPAAAVAAAIRRAKAQPPEAIRVTHVLHEHRQVFKALDGLSGLYLDMIDQFALLMGQAEEQGLTQVVATDYIQRSMYKNHKALHQTTFDQIYPGVTRAVADASLPLDVRRGLSELWSNFLELKGVVERLKGSSRVLRGRSDALKARHEQIARPLRKAFQLE